MRFSAVLVVLLVLLTELCSAALYADQHPTTACEMLFTAPNNLVLFPPERIYNSSICVPANGTDLAAIQAIDNVYWVTSLGDAFPESDCQIFEFSLTLNNADEFVTNVTAYLSGFNSDIDVGSKIRLAVWDYTIGNWTTLLDFNSSLSSHSTTNFTIAIDGVNLDPTRYLPNNTATFIACSNADAAASTPILYTWNGEKYVFVDETGYGILGSRSPYEDWADGKVGDYSSQIGTYPYVYTAFSSSLLAPNNNKYSVKLTSEKEEISYIDVAELWVIDHADDVVIYADFLMKPDVHAVQQPETALVTAVDQAGNDVTSVLASNDHNDWLQDIYLSPSFLDLDFGLTSQPSHFKLVLNFRWYKHPSYYQVVPQLGLRTRSRVIVQQWDSQQNTYVNAPDTYNPLHYPGRPKKEGINIHFTRTSLVIDLTGLQLDSSNRKIRLIFHDNSRPIQIDSITADFNAPASFTKTVLNVDSVTLDHRGRSRGIDLFSSSLQDSLDYYDLEIVSVQPWITGDFTKYGDITPVLQSADDEYAIMCRGDRLNIEFDASSVSAPSASRSFIFYNANFYKPQTRAYGHTVDPIPFASMPSYPYDPSQSSYDTVAHASYLSTYNTRHYEATVDHHSLNTDYIALDVYTDVSPTFNSEASFLFNWVAAIKSFLLNLF